jgi:hypothetical protein
VRRRLVSALLIGGNVEVARAATAAATSATSARAVGAPAGCVVAYSMFDQRARARRALRAHRGHGPRDPLHEPGRARAAAAGQLDAYTPDGPFPGRSAPLRASITSATPDAVV